MEIKRKAQISNKGQFVAQKAAEKEVPSIYEGRKTSIPKKINSVILNRIKSVLNFKKVLLWKH